MTIVQRPFVRRLLGSDIRRIIGRRDIYDRRPHTQIVYILGVIQTYFSFESANFRGYYHDFIRLFLCTTGGGDRKKKRKIHVFFMHFPPFLDFEFSSLNIIA